MCPLRPKRNVNFTHGQPFRCSWSRSPNERSPEVLASEGFPCNLFISAQAVSLNQSQSLVLLWPSPAVVGTGVLGAKVPANGALSCRLAPCYLIKLLEYHCSLVLAGHRNGILKTTANHCEMLSFSIDPQASVQPLFIMQRQTRFWCQIDVWLLSSSIINEQMRWDGFWNKDY